MMAASMKVLLVLFMHVALCASFTPEGLYVVLRSDIVTEVGNKLSLQASDTANTDTTTPPVQGSTSDVTYTFSEFLYDIDLTGFELQKAAPPSLQIGWSHFTFLFQWKYHMCATQWPNPCEDGYIQVYTTTNVKLQTSMTLDLSQKTASLVVDNVELIQNQGDVDVYVDCTSTFCLLPVDDIANAVAQAFISNFDLELKKLLGGVAAEYINTLNTYVEIPSLGINVKLNGGFDLYPSTNPNFILYAQGMFEKDGSSKSPPFNPTFVPPAAAFQSPSGQVNLLNTEYFFRTAVWALDLAGEFDDTITNADIPASSPVHLTTDDSFFLGAVPGLSKYPHKNITVDISLTNTSIVTIDASGIALANTFTASFVIVNSSTTTIPAFSLFIDLNLLFQSKSFMMKGDVSFNTTLKVQKVVAELDTTQVGPVSTFEITSALLLYLSIYPPQVPEVTLPSPQDFALSAPQLSFSTGYTTMAAQASYTVNPPSTVCPGGSVTCPVENTCCQDQSKWGCCTLPSAVCCGDGTCCPQGTQCSGGQCYGNVAASHSVPALNTTTSSSSSRFRSRNGSGIPLNLM